MSSAGLVFLFLFHPFPHFFSPFYFFHLFLMFSLLSRPYLLLQVGPTKLLLGGMGERCDLAQQGVGGAPAEIEFGPLWL